MNLIGAHRTVFFREWRNGNYYFQRGRIDFSSEITICYSLHVFDQSIPGQNLTPQVPAVEIVRQWIQSSVSPASRAKRNLPRVVVTKHFSDEDVSECPPSVLKQPVSQLHVQNNNHNPARERVLLWIEVLTQKKCLFRSKYESKDMIWIGRIPKFQKKMDNNLTSETQCGTKTSSLNVLCQHVKTVSVHVYSYTRSSFTEKFKRLNLKLLFPKKNFAPILDGFWHRQGYPSSITN